MRPRISDVLRAREWARGEWLPGQVSQWPIQFAARLSWLGGELL